MQRVRSAVTGTAGAIAAVAGWLGVTALAVLLVVVTLNVIGRYLGLYNLVGTDEVSAYLQVAIVYFGFAYTFRRGSFIRVDTLLTRCRGQARLLIEVALHLAALAFVILFTVYLWRLMADSYRFRGTSLGPLRVPLQYPQAIPVIGAAALGLQILARLAERLLAPGGAVLEREGEPTQI